jgi:hypothetical protein
VWTVVGSTGARTVDVLAFERRAASGVVYVLVCTAPTGHLAAAWLGARPGSCVRDDASFEAHRAALWALIEHLVGTFWILDLHGWQDDASSP